MTDRRATHSTPRAYAGLALAAARSSFERLPFPYKLTYALTYWCNYACKTCEIWRRKPVNELSLDEIRAFFARSNRFSWIDITGGEVFLRKDFLDVVDAILTSCTRLLLLHFPTNGYLTDAIVDGTRTIASWSPKKLILTVSVDGDQALNDEVRGIDGGWRRQVETFRRLRELDGVDVVLGFTLSRHNAGQLARCFDAARAELPELTWDDFHVNVAHRSPHYFGNHESDLVGDASAAIRADLAHFRAHRGAPFHPVAFLEHEYLRRVERYLDSGRTPIRCHALRSSCFVDPFGEVFPCTIDDRSVGNLRDVGYDLGEIWDRAETRRLQRGIWDGECPHCWTPCEAYPSILGSWFRGAPPGAPSVSSAPRR